MQPRDQRPRFIDGDLAEQADALAAVISELRPHIVVTYDPNGGYGHPDHVLAHRVTTAAVEASDWAVPKLYWSVMSASAIISGMAAMADVPQGWTRLTGEQVDSAFFSFADDEIDAAIEVPERLPAKVAALRAHQTQVSVSPDGRVFALSNGLALPIDGSEYFVLASGAAGTRDSRGWETDLLAGLNLG